jgi:hypothetical protein
MQADTRGYTQIHAGTCRYTQMQADTNRHTQMQADTSRYTPVTGPRGLREETLSSNVTGYHNTQYLTFITDFLSPSRVMVD